MVPEIVGGSHNFDVQFNDVSIIAASSSASDWCTTAAFNGFGANVSLFTTYAWRELTSYYSRFQFKEPLLWAENVP